MIDDAFRLSKPCWDHVDGASTIKAIEYLQSFSGGKNVRGNKQDSDRDK